ncbi:hypothetical protein [Streptomyces sp. NPDC007940]|uniref:hypothetical protein n=1 Tax=Streptomyces sp. NPDC007940 TaxID=3364796 RepID=UPI0036EDA986
MLRTRGTDHVIEAGSDVSLPLLVGVLIDERRLLRGLLRAEPCTVTLTQARTRITWTIRPVIFLLLAHRQGLDIPACAHQFKPRTGPSAGTASQ